MKPLTKNRAELLKLFFTNPNRDFYMPEIGRILNKKPGVFQRTLNNLASEGILESEPFLLEVLRDKKIMITGDEDELRKISKR